MKMLLAAAVLVFGAARAAHAQEIVPNATEPTRNVATPLTAFATEPSASFLMWSGSPRDARPGTSAVVMAESAEGASPSPAPAPDPKFVFGGRDDFRWQLGLGVDWLRFRSSIFNASAVGIKSSVTYFTNEWFGIEGNVSADFAPTIYANEHVKVLVYGAGPKIAWRERRWEPWAHAILGGSHEQPQTANHSKNTFAAELGGGADYRLNPRLSARLEANWVHTSFFSKSQNNFQLTGGAVFHF